MTRHLRHWAPLLAVAIAAAAATASACRSGPADTSESTATSLPARGGDLRVAIRTEPQSFNWFTRHDQSTYVVTVLTQAKLFEINRATQEVEASLAESASRSADGLHYAIKLKPDVAFADGHPLTADDVVFSFKAAYDERAGSALADAMTVGGKPLEVLALDPLTVSVTFPAPFAPGLRLFDNIPILPKHRLQAALDAKTFGTAWGLSTPLNEITGLGPFVLAEYLPGQRLVFSRNERYFKKDANGVTLPYLDRIILEIVPDQDAQVLRLEAGQIDLTVAEVRPEDYAPLKRAADAGRVRLFDLGGSLDADALWFNLKPGAYAKDPRAGWLQRTELRQALSLAVDRQLFADTVFLGAAVPIFGPVTPANRKWFSNDVPTTPHDPARAKSLLASIGLVDRNGDGTLEDPAGVPARFSVIVQKGQTPHERGAAVIRDELKKIGVLVDVVGLEGNAVVQRFLSGQNYDAVYFRLGATDTDPALNPDLWLSSGDARVWNLGQKTPATDWERRIDELMVRQTAAFDERERQQLFAEVQKILAEQLPLVYFVAPRVYVAAASRVLNVTPAVQRPQFLWAADTIAVRQ